MSRKPTGKPPGRPRKPDPKNPPLSELEDEPEPATSGLKVEEPRRENWHTWPKLADLAKELNLSRLRFAKQAIAEGYVFKRCPDQTMRIHPDEAEDCKVAVAQASAGEESVVLNNVPELLSASAKLVETANDQSRDLVKSLTDPLREVANAQKQLLLDMREIVKERTERVRELESRSDELAKQREAMLNEQAERNMAQKSFEASEERKKQGWDQLMKVTPVLGTQLMGTIAKWFNKDPEKAKRLAAAEGFLAKVTPDQAHTLIVSGFVQGEQRDLLVSIFGEPPTSETPEEKAPPAAGP